MIQLEDAQYIRYKARTGYDSGRSVF